MISRENTTDSNHVLLSNLFLFFFPVMVVPSIVVENNGSGSGMERQRPMKSRLSKQEEFDEVDEEDMTMDQMMVVVGVSGEDDGGGGIDNKKAHHEKMDTKMTKSLSNEGSPTLNKDRNENNSSVPRQRVKEKDKFKETSEIIVSADSDKAIICLLRRTWYVVNCTLVLFASSHCPYSPTTP